MSSLQGESAGRQQERALDKTRDLVRGLESLRERTAERVLFCPCREGGEMPGVLGVAGEIVERGGERRVWQIVS